jgi:hypothetical protein
VHAKVEPGRFRTAAEHIPQEKVSAVKRGTDALLRQVAAIGPHAQEWAAAMLQARLPDARQPVTWPRSDRQPGIFLARMDAAEKQPACQTATIALQCPPPPGPESCPDLRIRPVRAIQQLQYDHEHLHGN